MFRLGSNHILDDVDAIAYYVAHFDVCGIYVFKTYSLFSIEPSADHALVEANHISPIQHDYILVILVFPSFDCYRIPSQGVVLHLKKELA